MVRKIISSQFKAGKGSGLFGHPLLRLGAIAGIVLVVTLLVASTTLAARNSSHSADKVHFFQGVKTCQEYNTRPLLVCRFQASNVPLLLNAEIDYISVPVFFSDPTPIPEFATISGSALGHFDSDVVLTTTGRTPSTAYGHCTFYLPTGTGVCIYTHGTKSLTGFHATLAIGTLPDGVTNSVIGKYWFDSNDG